MAKRFTDTNKYKKPFIRGLQGAYKLLWDYLYHDCDHAGIWIVDFDIAQIYIGVDMPVNKEDALKFFNETEIRIVEINSGSKWFIPSFIDFQYGVLNEQNRAHNSVIKILTKYKLYKNKTLTSPLQGAKDKEKVKDKVKDKEKEIVYPFDSKEFLDAWNLWKEYKKEQFKFTYKPIGEQSALIDLSKISNLDENIAIKIIKNAIAKGWKGLYEIKDNNNGESITENAVREIAADLAREILDSDQQPK
jgi:hypothetical protein